MSAAGEYRNKIVLEAGGGAPAAEATLSGTVLSTDYAVIRWNAVVLRGSTTDHTFRVSVDRSLGYNVTVPEGLYDIDIESGPGLLPYRRANLRVLAGHRYTVNLYPVQRTGYAMTIHGDIALPDPEARYEEFLAGGGLKLVVQYQKRSRGDSVSYEGSPVVLTFDTVTIAGDAATLNPATMVATVEHASRLDLDGKVSQSIIPKSPRVELDINRRTIRIDSGTGSETLRF
jgi:hypothetical protein